MKMATFDSLAARLRFEFSPVDPAEIDGGFDENIAETISLLESENITVTDYLEGLEHIVVDEAQDVTGERKLLVASLLRHVSPSCGITTFADLAQAIYGFNERDMEDGKTPSLWDALCDDQSMNFRSLSLTVDHRTRNEALKELYANARRLLKDDSLQPEQKYWCLREMINDAATGTVPGIANQDVGYSRNSMILFRSRGELLSAATDLWCRGERARIRLTSDVTHLSPWIGAVLGTCNGTMNRAGFDAAWQEVWPPVESVTGDSAWSMLRRSAGKGGGEISLDNLANRLSSPSPPIHFVEDVPGNRGPVLSTIHGAKGREAERVTLMLPSGRGHDGTDWDEEARVLFVGATRACASLHVGGRQRGAGRLESGRLWNRWRWGGADHARVQIRSEDIDCLAQISTGINGSGAAVASTQEHLWSLANKITPLEAVRLEDSDCFSLYEVKPGGTQGEKPVGFLTGDLMGDLWEICNMVRGNTAHPARRIRGFWMIGARTVAARDAPAIATGDLDERYLSGRIWLAPIVAGLAGVFFNDNRGSAVV